MSESVANQIRSIMTSYGIPEYIWYPIARAESGLNPFATAAKTTEFSKGIFQINVKAHPEYAATNLYDPEINATIAAEKFLLPAFNYAKSVTADPQQQALIVYSGLKNPQAGSSAGYVPDGGIRPKWTQELMTRFTGYYDDFVQTSPFTGSGSGSGSTTPAPGSGSAWDKVKGLIIPGSTDTTSLKAGQQVAKFFIIVGIIIVGIVATFSLFKDTAAVKLIMRGTKAAATKGMSEINQGGE